MVRKLNVWLFVAVLFIIEVSGSKSSDLTSLRSVLESDSVFDVSDYWPLLMKLTKINPRFGDGGRVPEYDEKRKEIDNMQWTDSGEDIGIESKNSEDNGIKSEKTLNEINPRLGDDLRVLGYDEKLKEIDNLEWIDSGENSGLEILQLRQSSEVAGQRQFKFGKRVDGDKVVGTFTRNITYSRIRDMKTSLVYPFSGTGRTLTYIMIDVDQTSDVVRARVARGGIGQNFIEIIVEAEKILNFNCEAKFYGK